MDIIKLEQQGITGQQLDKGSPLPLGMGDHFWKFNFFNESGLKMIQFKTKPKIFIQKNICSIEKGKFNRIIHSKEFEENHSRLRKKAKI